MLTDITGLANLIANNEVRIFDCRFALDAPEQGCRDYLQGHIAGAVYADLNKHLSAPVVPGKTGRHPLPDKATWQNQLKQWGLRPEDRVVAYDNAGGAFASRLWWLLQWAGFSNVLILEGGWQAWQEQGLPVNQEVPEFPVSEGQFEFDDNLLCNRDQVQQLRLDPRYILIDARAAERYAGEVEPLDPVAGHIPGAENHPFQNNLTSSGRFKPANQLKADFQAIVQTRKAIHYCGSGVTACHNFFAMQLAGLNPGQLYAGSWSEWITDPDLPVATGKES